MSKIKNVFYKDLIWYALGTMIPMGINVIKTPIFTRHYSPEEYGYLGLVMTFFLYMSTVSYSWIAGCIWRFYNSFEKKKILNKFYSNILFLYCISSLVILFFTLIFITFYHDPLLVFNLIILCFLHFIIKELLGLFYFIIRVKGYTKLNNILLIAQVGLSFIVLLLLAFVYNFDITALISSSIIIDLLFVLSIAVYLIKTKRIKLLSFKLVHKKYLKIFTHFGSFILLSSLATLLIVSSDRYILAMYDSIENVGIYTKVYDIAQLSISALVFVFFNVINPNMNRELTHNLENADILLRKYLFAYIFTLLPFTILFSIFSKEISYLLLGEEFRNGHIIMPYVFFSAFIFGIINFNQNKLKFKNKLKIIVQILSFCFFINLILNFLFIPSFGYLGAAITTFISYIIMLILFFKADSLNFLKDKLALKSIANQLIVLLIFFIIDQLLRKIIEFNIWIAIIEGTIFLFTLGILFRKKLQALDLPV